MFGFLRKSLPFSVSALPIRNPSLSSPLRYITSNKNTNQDSFTVSYLINSCGLSPEDALSASKRVHFRTPYQADSVISLFKSHGFSQTQISSIIKRYPILLLSNPVKTFLPKLLFLHSIGLSSSDITKVVSSCPPLLHRSLENHIIPSYNILKDSLQSDEKTIAAIKRFHSILHCDLKTQMLATINFLRDNGLPESTIVNLLHYWPSMFITASDKVKKIVMEAKEMGFNPSKFQFVQAVGAFMLNKCTWERKMDVYKKWDWSEEEILVAFRQNPCIICTSEDKIMAVMDLFVNKLGCESSFLARQPKLFSYSLEKRLIPRTSVLQFLMSKGLVKKDCRGINIFSCSETTFLQKFVNCYDEAPKLLKLYGEKLALSRQQGDQKE